MTIVLQSKRRLGAKFPALISVLVSGLAFDRAAATTERCSTKNTRGKRQAEAQLVQTRHAQDLWCAGGHGFVRRACEGRRSAAIERDAGIDRRRQEGGQDFLLFRAGAQCRGR